jgi:hypothetical protein
VIETLRCGLERRRSELGLVGPPLRGGLLVGANKAEHLKVVILLFDEEGRLAAVAKVARGPEGESSLRAEHDVLRRLWSVGAASVTHHIPRPLLLEEFGGRLALILVPLEGEPMLTRYHSPGHTSDERRVAADLERAGSWLLAFQRGTAGGRVPIDEAMERWFEPALERYRREIGWGPEEQELFADVRTRARSLADASIPLTALHGDFWMGNLLEQDGRVSGVLDWEFGRAASPALRDVYKFPTSYGFYLDRAYAGRDPVPGHRGRTEIARAWARYGDWANLAGFGYTYFGRGWFPELIRRYVSEQLAVWDVPHEANAVFFPLFLAEQATALNVDDFRLGYRQLLRAFAREREASWLWSTSRTVSVR